MTKDSKKILYGLYKEYLQRRDNGDSKISAKSFGSASTIHKNIFSDIPLSDVEDALHELGNEGFVYNMYADDTVYYCTFTNHAIDVMENQKKETILSVVDFVSKFIP